MLINSAGFGAYGEFRNVDAQRLLDMVAVNVSSVVHLTHLFLPAMVERRSGDVMIVASTAAFQPVPYISTYAATKGFDLLFAEGIAEEVRRYGVRVCALCPGATMSEFNEVAGYSRVPPAAGRQRRSRRSASSAREKASRASSPGWATGSAWKSGLGTATIGHRAAARMFAPRDWDSTERNGLLSETK